MTAYLVVMVCIFALSFWSAIGNPRERVAVFIHTGMIAWTIVLLMERL